MKYYKKEQVKVETVERYIITKIKCDHCGELIEKNDKYCEILEYPRYPEDSLWKRYVHEKCLVEDIQNEYIDGYVNHIEIEFEKFYPYEEDDVSYEDIEEKENM